MENLLGARFEERNNHREFDHNVNEGLGFYVYGLFDLEGKPFYIGLGGALLHKSREGFIL